MAGKPLFNFGAPTRPAPIGHGTVTMPSPAPAMPIGQLAGMPALMGDTRYRGALKPPQPIGQPVTYQNGGGYQGRPMQPTGMMAQPQAVGMAMSGMSGQPAQAPNARMMVARALQNQRRY